MKINQNIEKVFSSDYCKNATSKSDIFWILSKSLSFFFQKYQKFPQSNEVPDMDASTENYLKIREIYL
jgi:hypothetical protein